jgi:hypothetical protein
MDNQYFAIYIIGYSAACKLTDLVIMIIRFGFRNHRSYIFDAAEENLI